MNKAENSTTEIEQTLEKPTVGELFLQFFQFGLFTFGGGWSIVAQMNTTYIEKKKVLTSEQLIDMTSVGRSLPGTMIGNIAILFGHRMRGFPGAIACLIGMTIPPMCILIPITMFYTAFRQNVWIAAAMTGVRAAVVPIIICALLNMLKGAFRFPPCYIVALITFVCFAFLNIGSIYLVVFGILAGLIISEICERRALK